MEEQKKYYVYRFKDKYDTITYVGRTVNLHERFITHHKPLNDVDKIEYIECKTEADMLWKEIYYINLFKNEKTMNKQSLSNDSPTELILNDQWLEFEDYNLLKTGNIEKYKMPIRKKQLIDNIRYYSQQLLDIQPENILTELEIQLKNNNLSERIKNNYKKRCEDIRNGTYYKDWEGEVHYICCIQSDKKELLDKFNYNYDEEYGINNDIEEIINNCEFYNEYCKNIYE